MKTKKWLELLVAGIAILTLVMLLTSVTGAASSNTGSIGFVDMEKLQNELQEFKNFQAVVKEKENSYKLYQGYIFSEHNSAIKVLQDKATSEKNGKSADEQATIEKRFQDDVKKKLDDTNGKLEKERAKIMEELKGLREKADENTKKLIGEVAADKKLTVVLEKNSVLFGGTDITDQVIEQAKKNEKKESKDESKTKKK
ncbi:MAG TPA: OmpH family outer membrane protein [Bacillota bacterium]|nr:OmpH family outer membrane protein [Bacillota bacterium]